MVYKGDSFMIPDKVHCLFEQSGTFKNEFIKLGIPAEDYDIQNNFGETNNVIDLFKEIERAYTGETSIFDQIGGGDLIMAFFPCIYFCAYNVLEFKLGSRNYKKLSLQENIERIIRRERNRSYYYTLLIKLFGVVMQRDLKMIVENPYTQPHYLYNNFLLPPTFIDNNRQRRGDYYKKPTAYWFVGFEPTMGCSFQQQKIKKLIQSSKSSDTLGICSEERSKISPDYARNFICDFILGKPQVGLTQLSLFKNIEK